MFLIRKKHFKTHIIFRLKRIKCGSAFGSSYPDLRCKSHLKLVTLPSLRFRTLKSVDEPGAQEQLGSKGELVRAGGCYASKFLPASPHHTGAAWAQKSEGTAASSKSRARTKMALPRSILPENPLDLSSILTLPPSHPPPDPAQQSGTPGSSQE